MSELAQPAAATAEPAPYPWRWIAFGVVLAGAVMDLLDSLATNVAGPTIRADIGGGSTLLQWLGASYTLAMAIGLIIGGRLGDLYGRRRILLIGMAGFTVGSVLCSVATQPGQLIVFRVVQGLFGAIMLPQGLGVIRRSFPPSELPAAFGAFGPVMGLSSVAGPVLAGWLIDGDYFGTGWRMIFLINLPIGLVAFLVGLRYLPPDGKPTASRLDGVGAVLIAVAAALLVYPVVQGRELGWPAWTFLLMAASVVVFAVFGRHEVRTQRRGRDPLVIPGLFRKRAFTGGLLAGLTFFTALVGFSLVLTIYLQIGLGYSPLKSGLTVLPQALGSVAGFVAASAGLTVKLGRTLIQIGTAVVAVGLVGITLTLHGVTPPATPWQLAPARALCGIGMGLVLSPFFDIVLAGVEPHETGSASGSLTAVQQFGGALGAAVLGTVFFDLLADNLHRLAHTAAFTHTIEQALWVAVALQAATFALAFLLPRRAREPEWGGEPGPGPGDAAAATAATTAAAPAAQGASPPPTVTESS
jgi:EmrB/QacA subfamily drug resistance transporter